MQTPKTVDISGHEVKIIVRDALYSAEGEPCCGLTFLEAGRIELARTCNGIKLSQDEFNESFLHECLHFICSKYSVNLREGQVLSLGVGLHQFLKDNRLKF